MRKFKSTKPLLLASALAVAGALFTVAALQAQMKAPAMVTLKGTIVDATCASKGKAMMNSWKNTEQDHMMPDGQIQKDCATMCLQGGQPAALFSAGKIEAIFACNPRATLASYAAKEVEVQGFWGDAKNGKTFVPTKIREGAGAWKDVDCATMHQ